jgi:hypothetical protein
MKIAYVVEGNLLNKEKIGHIGISGKILYCTDKSTYFSKNTPLE